jgi:hypothetical protein
MPSTFTHPLAVLPLRRLCPAPLNLAALVIGSMSPDFGYFVHQFPTARFAHTIVGTFIVCLPSGLTALAIFYLLRQPLCYVLPQPHRGALTPLASIRPSLSLRSVFSAVASVLLGAWTHTIWDSFTHAGAWSVERIFFLRESLFRIGGIVFPGSYVLQQVSTFGGAAALVLAYLLWLRRHRVAAPSTPDTFSDRHRYCLLVLLAVVALTVAVPAALSMASHFRGYLAFRVLVFRAGVYSAAVFIPLLALSSFVLYAIHQKKRPTQVQ